MRSAGVGPIGTRDVDFGETFWLADGTDTYSRSPCPATQGEMTAAPQTGNEFVAPEVCGGTWGYSDFLAAITDSKHQPHIDMMEWSSLSNLKPAMRRRQHKS